MEKILSEYLGCKEGDIIDIGNSYYRRGDIEYLVLTEFSSSVKLIELASELYNQELKNIPERLHKYFDYSKFIEHEAIDTIISDTYKEIYNEEMDEIFFIYEV